MKIERTELKKVGEDFVDKHGRTALIIAAKKGNLPAVTDLCQRGCSVGAVDREGLTALSWACLKGHLQCVHRLVEHGSAIGQKDYKGRRPLHLAVFSGNTAVFDFLISHGAEIDHRDQSELSVLDRAIGCGHLDIILTLLRLGAKLAPRSWQMTNGNTEVFILLLKKVIDDGKIFYRRHLLQKALDRFKYAFNKLLTNGGNSHYFLDIKLECLVSISRCLRKMDHPHEAVEYATAAIEVNPQSYEALYCRARSMYDAKMYSLALEDIMEAIKLQPRNEKLRVLFVHVKERCF